MFRRLKKLLSPSRLAELAACIRTTGQWPVVAGAYSGFCSLPDRWIFRTRRGSLLRVDDRDELTTVWHVFFSGEYTVPSDALTIVDPGANIGAFAVWAAETFPGATITSVEPFPGTFERLAENIQSNDLQHRVSCHCVAVSGRDGIARFDAAVNRRSYCRTILSDDDPGPSLDVPAVTLRTFLDQQGLLTVDCLKMDVEGAEYDILLSTDSVTLRRVGMITLEYHDSSKTDPLWKHLQNAGFVCVRQISMGWSGLASWRRASELQGTAH